MHHAAPPPWRVLLLGGASGAGKTSVSYRLASHFGVGITEVDDFQVVLERMTTPEQQPVLHYWRTHPDAVLLPAEQILERQIAVGRTMLPALEAVIANHIQTDTPVVLEGDFLLPELIDRFAGDADAGRVHAVFLDEPDEARLVRNFAEREPEAGEQVKRARVSWLYGQWLKREAERYGVPVAPARPWDTLLERLLAIVGGKQTRSASDPRGVSGPGPHDR